MGIDLCRSFVFPVAHLPFVRFRPSSVIKVPYDKAGSIKEMSALQVEYSRT